MKSITTLFFLMAIVLSNAQDLTQNYRKLILNSPNSISLFQSNSTSGIWASGMITGDRWGIFEDATSSKEWLTVLPGGKVGIGTITPASKLHVFNSGNQNGLIVENSSSSMTNYGLTVNNTSTTNGYLLRLRSSASDRVIVTGNGNLGIGTVNPGSYKLAVKGKIRAEEIKVETGWADYVFKENYDLPTLEEVERHIQEKGHLINIPSAEEVEENGIQLGEMNKLLLEKIEELTLYTLQQGKAIKELQTIKEENKLLHKKLDSLNALILKRLKNQN